MTAQARSPLVANLLARRRWQALLAPIGGASFRNAFRITVIGFTATNLLPGRLGEIVRPYLIARVEPVAAPAAFATVVIERVLDLGCVMLLFGVFLLTTAIDVGPDVRWAGLAAAVGLAAVVVAPGVTFPEVLGPGEATGPPSVRKASRAAVTTRGCAYQNPTSK